MKISFILKTLMLKSGITDFSLNFDAEKELVLIRFKLHGVPQSKIVTFTELEGLFMESDLSGPAEAPVPE